jgi:DNA-binding transcriptional LysR family regulator
MEEELRHLLLVVEHGTLTRAARHAHLSQPALSASIQRLEAWVGTAVLRRGRRGATLTAAGEAMLPHARACLAALADARRAAAEVAGLHRGEVRLGAGATACTYLLPPLLAELRRRHPGLHLRLSEGSSEATREAVACGDLDLGVVAGPPRAGEEPWRRDELVLVGPPDGAAPERHVSFTRPSPTRALLDQRFPEVEVVMELSSIAAVKGNVRAGVGVALVSRAAVAHDLAEGRLRLVDDPRTPLVRSLYLCHRGLERLSPAASALRALLREAED